MVLFARVIAAPRPCFALCTHHQRRVRLASTLGAPATAREVGIDLGRTRDGAQPASLFEHVFDDARRRGGILGVEVRANLLGVFWGEHGPSDDDFDLRRLAV